MKCLWFSYVKVWIECVNATNCNGLVETPKKDNHNKNDNKKKLFWIFWTLVDATNVLEIIIINYSLYRLRQFVCFDFFIMFNFITYECMKVLKGFLLYVERIDKEGSAWLFIIIESKGEENIKVNGFIFIRLEWCVKHFGIVDPN